MTEIRVASVEREDADLVDVVRRLFAGKWLIAALSFLGCLAAILYLHLAEPLYRTELRIAPAASSADRAGRVGALGGLAALAGVPLGSASQTVTPFDLYIESLLSRSMAEALSADSAIMRSAFRSEWNAEAGEWAEPHSIRRSMAGWFSTIVGVPRPAWHAPAAADLQEVIRRKLVIVEPDAKDAPITRLVIDDAQPEFASVLLSRMNQVADDWVRRNSLETARSYAAYLNEKLRSEQVAEYRRDLSEALGEQEKSIMLASSSAPYAATVIEQPTTSPRPVSPNAALALLVGILGGAMLGSMAALVDIRSLWRRIR